MDIPISANIPLKESTVPADIKKESELRQACADFESLILKQLLTAMRNSIPKSGLFGDSHAQEVYQAMQDDEMAKHLAQGRGMGLGEVLFNQLSGKTQSTTFK